MVGATLGTQESSCPSPELPTFKELTATDLTPPTILALASF